MNFCSLYIYIISSSYQVTWRLNTSYIAVYFDMGGDVGKYVTWEEMWENSEGYMWK